MSEPETIVTAPATKEKNPKRVAQGKRLAEISKAAKARKKLMMEEEEREEEERVEEEREEEEREEEEREKRKRGKERKPSNNDVGIDYKFDFGLIGVGVGIAGLYLTYSRENTSQEWVNICIPRKWKDVVDTPRSARNREITLEGLTKNFLFYQ